MKLKSDKDNMTEKGTLLGSNDVAKNTSTTYDSELICASDSTIGIITKVNI